LLSITTILSILFVACFFVWFTTWLLKPEKEDDKIVWTEDTSYMYHYQSRKARKKAEANVKGKAPARGKEANDKNAPTSK
jgi:hypothetical protein